MLSDMNLSVQRPAVPRIGAQEIFTISGMRGLLVQDEHRPRVAS